MQIPQMRTYYFIVTGGEHGQVACLAYAWERLLQHLSRLNRGGFYLREKIGSDMSEMCHHVCTSETAVAALLIYARFKRRYYEADLLLHSKSQVRHLSRGACLKLSNMIGLSSTHPSSLY